MDELKLFVMERVYWWWPCPMLFTYKSTPFRIHQNITGWTCHRMQHWINWHGIACSIDIQNTVGSKHGFIYLGFGLVVRCWKTTLRPHGVLYIKYCSTVPVLLFQCCILWHVRYAVRRTTCDYLVNSTRGACLKSDTLYFGFIFSTWNVPV